MKNIGIDIGKKWCVVCIMDEAGNSLEETKYENTRRSAALFADYVVGEYGPSRAVCESTGNLWQKTYESFEDAGVQTVLSNPWKTKVIAESSIKTDTVDARTLADLLRADLIAKCHVSDASVRGRKQLIRGMEGLIQDRTRVINRLQNLADRYDMDPKCLGGRIWRDSALSALAGQHLDDRNDDRVFHQFVRRIRHLNEEIGLVDGDIAAEAAASDDVRILMSMTGINYRAALIIATEIDDVSRFSHPKKLVACAGMCPTIHQSGNKAYHGRMRKDSNRRLNWIMVQCANVAVRYDPRMKQFYARVRKRHGHNVTLTHVANKMLRVIWAMLTNRELYRERNERLYQQKLKKLADLGRPACRN